MLTKCKYSVKITIIILLKGYVMKKRVILFFCVAILLLALPIGFCFASEECDHKLIDDNDCSTPVICTKCNETVIPAQEHDYSTTISFSMPKDEKGRDNFFVASTKRVRCSHEKCYSEKDVTIQPFVSSLGYAIKENVYDVTNKDGSISKKKDATIISTYIFNTAEIDEYAKLNKKEISFGTFVYKKYDLVKAIACGECSFFYEGNAKIEVGQEKLAWKDVPDSHTCPKCGASKSSFYLVTMPPYDSTTEKFNPNIFFSNQGNSGRITDLSIMKINESNYNAELVIASYFLIGTKLYYMQNDRIVDDHNEFVTVSCDKILEKLNQK